MRRMVIVGLVGAAGVVTVVAVAKRRAKGNGAADGGIVTTGPDWAPLRLAADPPASAEPGALAETAWVAAAADGSCPLTHPVKGKLSSGIFHVPGGRFYAVTRAQRCYVDAASAVADGLRPSQR